MHAVVMENIEGSVLLVHVQPKAATTGYIGLHGGALKIRVAAPPIDGAANEALRKYLAKLFSVPKNSVVVCAGQTGRKKRILLKNVGVLRVREVFGLTSS